MKVTSCLIAFVVLLSGCGQATYELVPASGNLKIDGKPGAGIVVQFMPDIVDETISAPTSQGVTDADGNFELFTLKNERGAVEGQHRVSLFDTQEERPEQGTVAARPPRLDPKYSSGNIQISVSAGTEIQLEATGPK